jgi:hypothetical protein
MLRGSMVAALLLFSGLPIWAASDSSSDFGKFIEFKPLVRHMISQVHCYDTGSDDCETDAHLGASFTKEHTMGFLLDGSSRKMQDRGFEPLYFCEARDDSGVMMVTAGTVESDPREVCRDAGFRPRRAGYISATDQLEAPWPLYRCVHPTTHDTLLTDDAAECTAATYGSAELLGYLYAGGPLSVN